MKTILISDTHFGVKGNSMTWFKYQMEFLKKQVIPYIKSLAEKENVRLYHLGDVFESRSSINPYIAQQIKEVFQELCDVCGVGGVHVIGGNHDYYSPVEQEANTNSLRLVLNELTFSNPYFHIIDKKMWFNEDTDLLVPWFRYDDMEKLEKEIQSWHAKRIFCHADLTHIDKEHLRIFKGCQVYSGHIHTPEMKGNLHTLGSAYALTFTDCNADRGFYVLDDNGMLEFHPNQYSIRFWRFRNNEIFDCMSKIKPDDYIELYVDQKLLMSDEYVNAIKEITSMAHNSTVIPVSEEITDAGNVDFETYNIEKLCKENIPEELADKFGKILKKINTQLT